MSMEVLFSIQPLLFAVFLDSDGSIHWSEYDGKKVTAAFPSADGARCVVLLDSQASPKPRFENLFCVDRSGKMLWTGELPDTHDCFIQAHMEPDGLHAWSFSGYWTVFDPADGHVIRREFGK
jgi:hypothetical protein